jgi:hypothetical protein
MVRHKLYVLNFGRLALLVTLDLSDLDCIDVLFLMSCLWNVCVIIVKAFFYL